MLASFSVFSVSETCSNNFSSTVNSLSVRNKKTGALKEKNTKSREELAKKTEKYMIMKIATAKF